MLNAQNRLGRPPLKGRKKRKSVLAPEHKGRKKKAPTTTIVNKGEKRGGQRGPTSFLFLPRSKKKADHRIGPQRKKKRRAWPPSGKKYPQKSRQEKKRGRRMNTSTGSLLRKEGRRGRRVLKRASGPEEGKPRPTYKKKKKERIAGGE